MAVKNGLARKVLMVAPHAGGWAVHHEGEVMDASMTQEEARAAANKRARTFLDAGVPCQVTVRGETGFFAVA